jgi:flagellar biosynthesis protein FlhA
MAVMLIPLPPILLDFLLALNITLAMTVLLIAMYTLEPLDFSVFPSLLLVMTLYRLSLNVASTRLILLNGDQGERAAGGVIKSFGSFVVGGDYVVGLVVFAILVIINFVVITKGATRIAEVAARFTLDAMPGKQMSIDADLNAGLIDEKQAKDRRARIAQEAEFYGSMDGAAKFVRGDAIAGIIVTLINIVGGFVIGVFQRGMPAIDAARTYTLLTIGDGLVSQIPALVMSTAAGIVVSRNASDSTMGDEFGKVFFKFHKAVYMASLSIFLFGLIPGLPHLSFILLAVAIGGGMYLFRRRHRATEARTAAEAPAEAIDRGSEPVEHLLAVDPIQMELGYRLIAIVDREQGGDFLERVRSIRRQFALEMGIVIPPIHIRDNLQLEPDEYQVLLRGVKVAGAKIMVGHYLAMDPGDAVQKIDGVPTTEPAFHLPAIWIPESKKEDAKLSGYTVVDNVTVMATHLSEVIRKHAWELIGRQEVQNLLDNLAKSYPKAVEELVPNLLSLGGVQKVLQNLLRERVSVRDLLTIVETLADYAPLTKDHDLLTEYVRHKLARSILEPYIGQDGTLQVITLSQEVEDVLAKGVETTDYGAYLSISPKHADIIAANIKAQADKAMARNIQPIVLTSPAIRRHLKKMMEYFVPTLIVISQSELMGDTRIQSIGEVGLSHDR